MTEWAFRYTSHQVPRGSRPDAVSGRDWYLFKNVSLLRLTYQLRLLTLLASEEGSRLHVRVPEGYRLSADMRDFARGHKRVLRIEPVSD